MDSILAASLSALWFGILTSVSPCPLATNIAAMSFISKHIDSNKKVVAAGALYTLGRMLAYLLLSLMIVYGLLSIPSLSFFLQENMNRLLGPVLIVSGFFILGIVPLSLPGFLSHDKLTAIAEKGNLLSAGFLGFIFALSFCPVSAALFFGSLIPITLQYKSTVLLPFLYGIGTGLPVFVIALIICFSAQSIGKVFNTMSAITKWAGKITGLIFIAAGSYYSYIYLFVLITGS